MCASFNRQNTSRLSVFVNMCLKCVFGNNTAEVWKYVDSLVFQEMLQERYAVGLGRGLMGPKHCQLCAAHGTGKYLTELPCSGGAETSTAPYRPLCRDEGGGDMWNGASCSYKRENNWNSVSYSPETWGGNKGEQWGGETWRFQGKWLHLEDTCLHSHRHFLLPSNFHGYLDPSWMWLLSKLYMSQDRSQQIDKPNGVRHD